MAPMHPPRMPLIVLVWFVAMSVTLAYLTGAPARAGQAPDPAGVQLVTEDLPPFNYEEDGKVRGAAVEAVRAILEELGLDLPIQSYPWVRAYEMALDEPNVALFSIARTPEREDSFHWIGILAPANAYLFALESREDIQVDSLEDAREYEIGVFRRGAPQSYLEQHGFTVDEELVSVYGHERLYDLLRYERIDLWAVTLESVPHILADMRKKPRASLRPVFKLSDMIRGDGLYLVLSKETPKETVTAFREAYRRIVDEGKLESILAEHGMAFTASE